MTECSKLEWLIVHVRLLHFSLTFAEKVANIVQHYGYQLSANIGHRWKFLASTLSLSSLLHSCIDKVKKVLYTRLILAPLRQELTQVQYLRLKLGAYP
jgi:hypothetical protein